MAGITKITLFLTILAAGLLIPMPVQAHKVVQQDGVTALVHITPDDNPVAGSEDISNISFDVSGTIVDKSLYSYTIDITEPGGDSESVYAYYNATSETVTSIYKFPRVGSYTLSLIATGVDDESLGFTIDYVQEVTRSSNDASNSGPIVLALVVMAIGASTLATVVVAMRRQKS